MRIFVAALLALTITFPGPVFAETPLPAAPIALKIYNFGQMGPNYFRGSQPDETQVAALAKAGVKLVIDLQKDGSAAEEDMVKAAGMRYVKIPMTTRVVPTADQLKEFLSLVSDPANLPVYVHCREGRHRTGVMSAVYRMTQDGWTPKQAFQEMKDFKFGMDFLHPEFKKFVLAFKVPTLVPVLAEAK